MRAARRNLADYAPPVAIPAAGVVTQVLQIRVMTVLYGGGVHKAQTDAAFPFRESSVRGHLRFWWRATAGGQYANYSELLRHESVIFGDQAHRSPVAVRVVNASAGRRLAATDYVAGPANRGLAYALFPACEDREHPGYIYENGAFELKIDIEKHLPEQAFGELWAALNAWLVFGGIGSRTRRGAGALYCRDFAGGWDASKFCGDGTARPWPTLRGAQIVLGDTRQSLPWKQCWNQCLETMRQFRQDRTGAGGRGRSKWPEADEIRRIRRQYVPRHAPANPERGFPRAAFGMPILFHFKSDRTDLPDRDPEQNTLTPAASERMASPVILRPFAISDTDAVPMMLVLNTPEAPQDLLLQQARAADFRVARGPRDAIAELIGKAARDWRGKAGVLS